MDNLEVTYVKIEELIPYVNNSRTHSDKQITQICSSINEYGFTTPIIIDEQKNVLAGHGRLEAVKRLGWNEVPCVTLKGLTKAQKKAYVIADNKLALNADWDLNTLENELKGLKELDFDLELTGFDDDFLKELETQSKYSDESNKSSLSQRFLVPPMSVFDTKQKYWQDRRREWLRMGIKSEIGRSDDLMFGQTMKAVSGLPSTSIFDPVLCEVCYKWFNVDNGKILDPFAGGSVRGIVASKLGYDYFGCDLRQEQIEANKVNAEELGVDPKWVCDDSQNIDKYVEENSVDMVFSCPPYADLEKYSDDERDLSNMDYADFIKAYENIIAKCVKVLKQDRFAVFVVGDIRDPQGFYRNFIADTKECFIKNGAKLYNEIILLNSLGTSALRADANGNFTKYRKTCKVHQNVLVFYKGNPKNIKNNFKEIEIMELSEEEE